MNVGHHPRSSITHVIPVDAVIKIRVHRALPGGYRVGIEAHLDIMGATRAFRFGYFNF